jgi:pimeloyl-ACP methyl ester carboxylesterase
MQETNAFNFFRHFLRRITPRGGVPAAATAEARVEGLKIHYTIQGSGRTIVFVHGWTCDETSWRQQVSAFSRDYRVITIDLPGHGKSEIPAPENFSMRLFAATIEAVRIQVGADRVALVDHSMGALVIRRYALDFPKQVAGLVSADGPLDAQATPAEG